MAEVLTVNEEEKRLIQNAYRDLLRSIKSEMTEEDRINIRQSYELAVQAHSEQRRQSQRRGGFASKTAPPANRQINRLANSC